MKIFQGTRRPALGAVALVHFVVDCAFCRLLTILAWAQALQNWDQLVAFDHIHDILSCGLACWIRWIKGALIGLEFESYSTPIVQRVRELELDGHWACVSWRNGIVNQDQSRTFNLRAFTALSKAIGSSSRRAAASQLHITARIFWECRVGRHCNWIAELEPRG